MTTRPIDAVKVGDDVRLTYWVGQPRWQTRTHGRVTSVTGTTVELGAATPLTLGRVVVRSSTLVSKSAVSEVEYL